MMNRKLAQLPLPLAFAVMLVLAAIAGCGDDSCRPIVTHEEATVIVLSDESGKPYFARQVAVDVDDREIYLSPVDRHYGVWQTHAINPNARRLKVYVWADGEYSGRAYTVERSDRIPVTVDKPYQIQEVEL